MSRSLSLSSKPDAEDDAVGTTTSQPMEATRRRCLIVLGMHRSGTSAVTRILSLAGAKLPKDLMGTGVGNETGHWESTVLSDLHDGLLAECSSRWDDWGPLDLAKLPQGRKAVLTRDLAAAVAGQFGDDPLIVVKDPRICRFTPLFLEALAAGGYEPRCILAMRSPLEVIASLEKRNLMRRGPAALLWLRSNLDCEYATRHLPRVAFDYGDLLEDWRGVLERTRDRLEIPFRYTPDEIEDQVDRFLSPERRHHVASLEEILFDPALRAWVGDAYTALLVLRRNPTSASAFATLDRVRKELDAATPMLRKFAQETEEALVGQRHYFEQEISAARHEADRAARAVKALDERVRELDADLQAREVRESDALRRVAAVEAANAEALLGRDEAEIRAGLAANRAVEAEARLAEIEADARSRIAAAEQAIQEAARGREHAEAHASEAAARAAESATNLLAMRSTLAAAVEDHERTAARVSALEILLGERESLLGEAREELGTVRNAFEALTAAIESLRLKHEQDLARHESVATATELSLQTSLRSSEDRILDAEAAVAAHERRLEQLQAEAATLGARVGRLLSRWRRRLAPAGSRRVRVLGRLARFGERLYRFGGPRPTPLPSSDPIPVATAVQAATAESAQPSAIVAAAPADYAAWIEASEPTPDDLSRQRNAHDVLERGPLISIVLPIYKVPADVLAGTLRSLVAQTYPKWEACIAYADVDNDSNWSLIEEFARRDDRFRPRRLTENLGISGNSNVALTAAAGDFIGLLDHDDELTPWALHDMARAILSDDQVDFLYSDKDSVDESGTVRTNPLFKPEWSPEMLYSVNYLTHFNVMRRSLVDAIGGWRSETDGAQDWDLFLRVTERSRRIRRVCGVHYHWRVLPTSVASGIEAKPYATAAQLRTIKDRVERLGLTACVMADRESGFRLSWRPPRKPAVDLVVVGDSADRLAGLGAQGSHDFSAWVASVSIVGGSPDAGRGLFGTVPVRHVPVSGSRGTTAAILEAASAGSGSVLAFLDTDVDHATPGWIDELAGWVLGHPEIAFVGSLLLTPLDEVLEAGRVTGASGTSAALFNGTPLRHWGPLGGPLWFRNVSAVGPHAAACRRSWWPAVTAGESRLDWREVFVARCERMTAEGRGVVSPHVRIVRSRRESDDRHYWDDTFRDDPYFHPGFESVAPLRMRGDGA